MSRMAFVGKVGAMVGDADAAAETAVAPAAPEKSWLQKQTAKIDLRRSGYVAAGAVIAPVVAKKVLNIRGGKKTKYGAAVVGAILGWLADDYLLSAGSEKYF